MQYDFTRARRIVIKIGSATIVDRRTGLRRGWLASLIAAAAVHPGQSQSSLTCGANSWQRSRVVAGSPEPSSLARQCCNGMFHDCQVGPGTAASTSARSLSSPCELPSVPPG